MILFFFFNDTATTEIYTLSLHDALPISDHPAVSCMASQYAGWAIQVDKYFAMGSGPLRAHARVERELFAKLGYAETAPRGVLVLETRNPPTEAVAAWVAAKAGLVPAHLTFVVAPTASLAGGVQDRKSTRLNSSHSQISYAVFCLNNKKHIMYVS